MKYSAAPLLSVLSSQIEDTSGLPPISSGLLWYHFIQYQVHPDPQRVPQILRQWQAILERATTENCTALALIITDTLQARGWIAPELAQKVQAYDEQLLRSTSDWLADPLWENLYRATEIGYYLAHRGQKDYLAKWIDVSVGQADPGHYFDKYTEREPVFLLGVEGLTGILLMLEAIARLSQQRVLYRVLQSGVSLLLSFRREVDFSAHQYSVFPQLANAPYQSSLWPDLLGWSGSDLMQSLLLHRAATLLEDVSLRKTADLVGLNTLLRHKEQGAVTDSTNVYHGTAGIAQCYRALHKASELKAYKQGYTYWIGQTVEQLSAKDEPLYEVHDLLHGLVGIALVLLSYQYSESLDWERVIIL